MDVFIRAKGAKQQRKLRQKALVDHFRDCYNSHSLANWLAQNIDPDARGEVGLALFDTNRRHFNTHQWRQSLLRTTQRWQTKAKGFRDKPSYVGYPHERRIRISAEQTNHYLDWLEDLVRFARGVVECRAKVEVWG